MATPPIKHMAELPLTPPSDAVEGRRGFLRRAGLGIGVVASASFVQACDTNEVEVPGEGTLRGVVVDPDGDPVEGATVSIDGTNFTMMTGENGGYGELDLPELDLHTMSYWLTLASARLEASYGGGEASVWARVVQGGGQVIKTSASLLLMCDPRDVELCIGSVAQDQWLHTSFDGLQVRSASGDEQAAGGRVGPALYNPTIFVYDRFPGGVGFGEGLYERHVQLMGMARDLVTGCGCQSGCPSCVGPPSQGEVPVKERVSALLGALAVGSQGPASG